MLTYLLILTSQFAWANQRNLSQFKFPTSPLFLISPLIPCLSHAREWSTRPPHDGRRCDYYCEIRYIFDHLGSYDRANYHRWSTVEHVRVLLWRTPRYGHWSLISQASRPFLCCWSWASLSSVLQSRHAAKVKSTSTKPINLISPSTVEQSLCVRAQSIWYMPCLNS